MRSSEYRQPYLQAGVRQQLTCHSRQELVVVILQINVSTHNTSLSDVTDVSCWQHATRLFTKK